MGFSTGPFQHKIARIGVRASNGFARPRKAVGVAPINLQRWAATAY
jgi:hypothetical protein